MNRADDILAAELLVIDVYNDGDVIRVVKNTPEAKAAIRDWQALDKAYCNGQLSEDDWQPFTDYLESRGIEMFTTETIDL